MYKYFFVFIVFFITGCEQDLPLDSKISAVNIIPKPATVTVLKGAFIWDHSQTIYADSIGVNAQEFLLSFLERASIKLEKSTKEEATIQILFKKEIPSEGYELNVESNTIRVLASDSAGAFFAIQSLRQLMPIQFEALESLQAIAFKIPMVQIKDAPSFAYRGMHLDVSRHFFGVKEVKEYIDMLAMLKMNRFHWHLTDDQGWRIEIKKYPKLQSHAAYRDQTLIGHYNDTPQAFDGKKYGGYYTQEEVKEIVAYASSLQITVIPEIEMPGHAQAAISAYPNLGCTGNKVKVAQKWGVFEDIFCPKPQTFQFLKDVLDEVTALFPGEYIHIGGDEAPKARWNSCSHCKNLIKQKKLGDAHGLQSYFIREIEAYLNSKGKNIIGWDEILEGGLAPNATVMSWRGTSGAVEAAKQGNDVILTPNSHAYFDHYQDTSPDEPLAIGGYLPLKKVYSFSPYPAEMDSVSRKYVLGAQGNLWTEYITTQKKLQYMAYPRTMAMSEVVWSGPSENLDKDYPNFLERLELFFERLDAMQVNYANHLNNLEGTVLKSNDSLFYALKAPIAGKRIRYWVNGLEKTIYSEPIYIKEDALIAAAVYKNNIAQGDVLKQEFKIHTGVRATLSINKSPHPSYNAGGIKALNDGVMGSNTRYGDSQWLGFWGEDLEINLALANPTAVKEIILRFYNAPGQWIHPPKNVTAVAKLSDGSSLTVKGIIDTDGLISLYKLNVANQTVESIRLIIPNYGTIPKGKQGAGNKAWTFIDEIVIE